MRQNKNVYHALTSGWVSGREGGEDEASDDKPTSTLNINGWLCGRICITWGEINEPGRIDSNTVCVTVAVAAAVCGNASTFTRTSHYIGPHIINWCPVISLQWAVPLTPHSDLSIRSFSLQHLISACLNNEQNEYKIKEKKRAKERKIERHDSWIASKSMLQLQWLGGVR